MYFGPQEFIAYFIGFGLMLVGAVWLIFGIAFKIANAIAYQREVREWVAAKSRENEQVNAAFESIMETNGMR